MKRLITLAVVICLLLTAAPAVFAAYPDPGPGRTNIFMQNIGVNDATVGLVFTTGETGGQAWTYDAGGVIKPKASKYVLYTQFGVSDGWAGAVEVSATEPLAAIVNMFWDAANGAKTAATYTGVADPATGVYLPVLSVRDNIDTCRITIQNTEDAVASITMNFFDRNGTATGSKTDTIPAKSEKTFYLESVTQANFAATSGMGSAYVTSDKKIAAVVTRHWLTQSEAYSGVSAGDTTLWIPGAFRKQVGSVWSFTAAIIQNLGGSAANVHLQFIKADNSISFEMDDTIAPKASNGYNLTAKGTMDQTKYNNMIAALGTNWQGTIKVSCTNGQQLAGVVYYFAYGSNVQDCISYMAIRDVDATTKALSAPAVYRKLGAGNQQWSTTLVQNISNTAGTVAVELYGTDGVKKGSTYTINIPANGMVRLNLKTALELPQAALDAAGTNFAGGMFITPSTGVKIVGVTDLFWSTEGRASGYDAFPVP